MSARRPGRSAAEYFPASCPPNAVEACGLTPLRHAAAACRGCDLYLHATQTVFGEGNRHAALMLVGEEPGDEEDIGGHPFIGPASRELDAALSAAGIRRCDLWVTNAVKHFKFELKGDRRMHAKPTMHEVRACRPWLDAEIALIEPEVVVLLGATAAHSLLGPGFSVKAERGVPQDLQGRKAVPTWHPSAILRAPSREDRHRMRDEFASDLRVAAGLQRKAA